ncbi:hypothetical protein HK096_003564, partial [Nowakowskiella sp. JEL0078]
LGAASSLEWSTDGYALAVGWLVGGCSVWSVFGRLLLSTISEDTFVQSPSDKIFRDGLPNFTDSYFHGVRDLFWGMGSYELFLLPLTGLRGEPATEIHVLQFLKSGIVTQNSVDNVRNVFLVSEDRLLLFEGNNHEFDVMNLDLVQWDTVQIPVMYITENWPIKCAAMNATGNYIAIAGKRGLAHYSTVSKRWKLFGNEQQEQSFVVNGGMAWYRNILIVGCKDLNTQEHEIRFYSRETNLDNSFILHVEKVSKPVLMMDCIESNLLIYSGDNIIRYYQIFTVGQGSYVCLINGIS